MTIDADRTGATVALRGRRADARGLGLDAGPAAGAARGRRRAPGAQGRPDHRRLPGAACAARTSTVDGAVAAAWPSSRR